MKFLTTIFILFFTLSLSAQKSVFVSNTGTEYRFYDDCVSITDFLTTDFEIKSVEYIDDGVIYETNGITFTVFYDEKGGIKFFIMSDSRSEEYLIELN